MVEFVGGEPISIGVDEPITFENKTDTVFDVGCGIVFRKSGLYRVSIVGKHMSVAVEPERKRGRWIEIERRDVNPLTGRHGVYVGCSECGGAIPTESELDFIDEGEVLWCPYCGSFNGGEQDNSI